MVKNVKFWKMKIIITSLLAIFTLILLILNSLKKSKILEIKEKNNELKKNISECEKKYKKIRENLENNEIEIEHLKFENKQLKNKKNGN